MGPREINEDEKEILIEYYVQNVSGRLRLLVSPNEKDKKRWIWELLQNAKDSVYYLARVFDVNGNPELYLMKLETALEIS